MHLDCLLSDSDPLLPAIPGIFESSGMDHWPKSRSSNKLAATHLLFVKWREIGSPPCEVVVAMLRLVARLVSTGMACRDDVGGVASVGFTFRLIQSPQGPCFEMTHHDHLFRSCQRFITAVDLAGSLASVTGRDSRIPVVGRKGARKA